MKEFALFGGTDAYRYLFLHRICSAQLVLAGSTGLKG